MEACIISTAQQASPNVIHISEPVRAQLIRSSVVVTRKPLSASLLDSSPNPRSPGTTRPDLGCARVVTRFFPTAYCLLPTAASSIPFQRALAPLVDEADRQDAQEGHHGPEAEDAYLLDRHRPGEEEGDLQV